MQQLSTPRPPLHVIIEPKGDDEVTTTNYHIAGDRTETMNMRMVDKRKKQ